MRVLDVHAEHCSFETVAAPPAEDAPDPEAATPEPADDAPPAPREGGFDDCLAALVAVEGDDAHDPDAVAAEAADHLVDRAADLRLSRVLVYPCPALSERPTDHGTSVECCRALARALDERGDDLDVLRAPVGWHHALTLSTAGHPFAESVTRFTGEVEVRKMESEWTVVVDGERRDVEAARPDLDADTCEAFELAMEGPTVDHLLARGEWDDGQPSLVEPDGLGGRRLLPAGRLVHDLLADRVHDRLLDAGAAPIETGVTYDPSDPETARLLGAFTTVDAYPGQGARLRPSARLGALALLRDADLRPVDCPLRLAETGPVERAWGGATVPTAHAVTADRDGGWAALVEFAGLVVALHRECGLDAVPVCYADGGVPPDRLDEVAAALDRPLLVHRDAAADDGSARVRLEFHDARRDPGDVPHVRLDPGLAERAGIAFEGGDDGPDGDGSRSGPARVRPVVVDCEPFGSLDAARAALWESPPVWLAPTQVRFVTVDADHRDRATTLADEVTGAGLRADVDDRALPVGERLDRAARDRVPFVVVVGDRETDAAALTVWDRRAGTERSLSDGALVTLVEDAVDGFPRRARYLPPFVTDGPLGGTMVGRKGAGGEE
ncbi:threonyl-tRNA synthetase editing domain-containing protein [Haloglomus litoreum]|uniref:threonyl-tRNA synthetase editing domain-containing protein n=1 Tax=Haloglomus litoreum TaxID=3034026 RepID=UPI0023E75C6D|nr:threonyl-tRNA synthetase editing domain-containing protein [Haloglomus sp. DT116]